MTTETPAATDAERIDDVLVVGDGLAGLSVAIFTARAGLETRVVGDDEPIVHRNAHVENYPGFPAGVNPRVLTEMTRDQAERAGTILTHGLVQRVERAESTPVGFRVHTNDGRTFDAHRVVAASWSDTAYLDAVDVERIDRGSKSFLDVDSVGHTSVSGLYAAGRIAETHHQAIVAAGHGSQVGLTILDDCDRPFYHDWVAPSGYFTDRARDVPPGCEEIEEDERRQREAESMATMQEYFAEPHPGSPTMHPSAEE